MNKLRPKIVEQKIIDIIRLEVVSLPSSLENYDPEKIKFLSFESLNFDSLAFMELCIAIFCNFSLELSIEKCQELGTIDAVVNYLCDHEHSS